MSIEAPTLGEQRTERADRGATVSHVLLRSLDAVLAERERWDDIVARRYHGNPFLCMDWHAVWLRHFARPPVGIRYLRVMRGERAAGYFPFIVRRVSAHGVKVRQLSYAGNLYSPINCPILDGPGEQEVLNYAISLTLKEVGWDVFSVLDLPEEYPGRDELAAVLMKAGCRPEMFPDQENLYYEDLDADADAYFRNLKPNIRNDTRRFPKKLSEMGELSFRLIGGDLTDADIAAYREVYGRSWKEAEFAPDFHPDVMRAASRQGALRLGILYLSGRPISTQLWLLRQNRGYVVKTAYDEQFRQFSPGTILTWRVLERLMTDDGMRYFDFLKGDDAYKKNWTNRRRQRHGMVAFAPNARGRAARFVERGLIPWVRRNRVLNGIKVKLSSAVRKT